MIRFLKPMICWSNKKYSLYRKERLERKEQKKQTKNKIMLLINDDFDTYEKCLHISEKLKGIQIKNNKIAPE